jgi:hypothetical protein
MNYSGFQSSCHIINIDFWALLGKFGSATSRSRLPAESARLFGFVVKVKGEGSEGP